MPIIALLHWLFMFLLKVPDGSIQLDLLRELSDYEVRLKEKDEEIAKLKKSVEFNFEIIKQVKIKRSFLKKI